MKSRLFLFLFLFLTASLLADEPKTVKLTLSPETTYITEPRLPDGRIDYLAAINKQLAATTTPESNLVVGVFSLIAGETAEVFLREAGNTEYLKEIDHLRSYRERFWKMLGVAPPPLESLVWSHPTQQKRDYEKELLEFYSKERLESLLKERFNERRKAGKITQEDYDKEIKKIGTETPAWHYEGIVHDQWEEARKRPWTAEEFPYLAHWIATTDDWTPKLIGASRRKGYYSPWLDYRDDSTILYSVVLPYPQSFRSPARFFQTRGNWDFTRGRLDQAMECGFASVRMGWTIRKGSYSIVEDLVGISLIGFGVDQLATYLAELPKGTDAAWILQRKNDFDSIESVVGPLPSPPTWCNGERFGMLSAIQSIAVEPKIAHEFFRTGFDDKELITKYEKLFDFNRDYDWDEIMKRANRFYDDLEDILVLPDWPRRFKAAERFEKRIAECGKRSIDSADSPEQRAFDFLISSVAPSIESVIFALARSEWEMRITSVAFSLAAYRADHDGNDPDSLEKLVPKYLDRIPLSPFTEKPLRYLKRQHDVLIACDDFYKLDGNEPELEKSIAETKSGGRAYPSSRHFVFVVRKTK